MKINRIIIILAAVLFISQTFAKSHAPATITASTLKAKGHTTTIPAGTFLRLVNFKKNSDNWYHEVLLVDENNRILNKTPVRISQQYLYKNISSSINSKLEIIDEVTGKKVRAYKNQRYIITDAKNKGWKTYSIQFIDENGLYTDNKGIPSEIPHGYKITQKYLRSDRLRSPVRKLFNVQKAGTSGVTPGQHCATPKEKSKKYSYQKKKKKKKNISTAYKSKGSSFADLKRSERRGRARRNSARTCRNKKAKVEKAYLRKHSYGKKSVSQRANQILADAKKVIKAIRASKGKKLSSLVTPQLMACIAYQETKGTLNPYAVNYTLCNKKMISSAHGLGQTVFKTYKWLKESGNIPYTSKYSKKYRSMSKAQAHSNMSGDQFMQLEVMARHLSVNMPRGRGLRKTTKIRRAVLRYDQDSKSRYLKNIMNRCLPCFNRGGSGKTCYKKLR